MSVYRFFIAKRIKAYRKAQRISQTEFGKLLGVTAQAVCKWEQGVCYPDLLLLPRLAEILDCRIDDFFYERPTEGASEASPHS